MNLYQRLVSYQQNAVRTEDVAPLRRSSAPVARRYPAAPVRRPLPLA
jgi:hypothetical protein